MVINLIGNIRDGKGLAADARMLRGLIEGWGHECVDLDYDATTNAATADLNIFLEVYAPQLRHLAPRSVLVPNVELYFSHAHGRSSYDAIWTKTRDATRVLVDRDPQYMGFTTEDVYRRTPRHLSVLHVAGGGRFRNTPAVIQAWLKQGHRLPPLTVVATPTVTDYHRIWDPPEGVTLIKRLQRGHFLELMNQHAIHLLPSQYEGFGAALWEGRSCGAIVLTSDAAPMNEGGAGRYIPVDHREEIRRGCLVSGAVVAPGAIVESVIEAAKSAKATLGNDMACVAERESWERGRKDFKKALRKLLDKALG